MGTAWFYIESASSTEEVREVFDAIFLNSVSQIVEKDGSYWIFVDMGRSCSLLEKYRDIPWQHWHQWKHMTF